MFQEALQDIVERSAGYASIVMDLDGIALDAWSSPDATYDINTVGIELSVVIKSVKQATTMLEAGDTHEVAIRSDQLVTVVRLVADNYFVAVSLPSTGNIGKARYVLRTKAQELNEQLS